MLSSFDVQQDSVNPSPQVTNAKNMKLEQLGENVCMYASICH